MQGESENLTFKDNEFEAITGGSGVRNYETLAKGLLEMNRVLSPGGKVMVLEYCKPSAFPIKQMFTFYSKYILPLWGKIFSGSQEAYVYLPESVKHFPEGQNFIDILEQCAYNKTSFSRLTFGITTVYEGTK